MMSARIIVAAELLGWHGETRWPVRANGLAMAAICGPRLDGPPGSCGLIGCLVPGHDQSEVICEASQLAGYSARAVLVDAPVDTVDLAMQAALLDVGAVTDVDGQLSLVSTAGDVVPSPLQLGNAWRTDPQWQQLLKAIAHTPVVGRT